MANTFLNLPGIRIQEVLLSAPPIVGVSTSIAGFVGTAPKSDRFVNQAVLITSADQFIANYVFAPPAAGSSDPETRDQAQDATASTDLSRAVFGFFANGGGACYIVNVNSADAKDVVAGIRLLELIGDISLIAAPGQTDPSVYGELSDQAARTANRFAILDPADAIANPSSLAAPLDSEYAAFYYPRIMVGPQLSGDGKTSVAVAPSGHIAGIYARVDANRGVHKAPANEALLGALDVQQLIADGDQDQLNAKGVNVLRVFSGNVVVWGARTVSKDTLWRYVNVRRLVTYVEQSLKQGLRWAVFEPNNLALRQQINRAARGFLDGVWRDGALFGATPDEAYYVRFPDIYNRDEDRAQGRLTVEIGLRVSYPAEFIVVRIGLLLQSAASA